MKQLTLATAEVPYDQMAPEQQDGYRFVKQTCGQVGGPSKIWYTIPNWRRQRARLALISIPAITL